MSGKPTAAVGVGRHYARYSSATVLVMLAGLISFPALTRLLDNTEYGILGYYDTWVMMAVAIIKLGAQHAILRLYPFGGDEARLRHFATNLVLLPMLVSLAIWTLALVVFAGVGWTGRVSYAPVLWCAVLSMPLLVFTSQIQMTLRASEHSRLLMVTRVSARWLELALVLAVVLAIQRSALAVYAGKLLAMLLLSAFFLRWAYRHLHVDRASLDLGAYRESLHYSLPLVVNEIAGAALVSIDRVMLKSMLGDFASVGIYTIGYALAMQLGVIMSTPLWEAFNPVANRVHGLEGAAQVRALKAKVLLPASYACIGTAIGIWMLGADGLRLLSGADKAASGPVFAWIGTMFALVPLVDLCGYGLLLKMRTRTVLAITLLATLTNIGLNLMWIPAYGYMGAVYATAISYAVLCFGRCLMCPRELRQLPDLRTLLVSVGAAALFVLAVRATGLFGLVAPWARVGAGGGLWLLCYALPSLLLDRRLRALAATGLRRLRGGRAG
jgi:O-antigen/teichoic acid export membrane protein